MASNKSFIIEKKTFRQKNRTVKHHAANVMLKEKKQNYPPSVDYAFKGSKIQISLQKQTVSGTLAIAIVGRHCLSLSYLLCLTEVDLTGIVSENKRFDSCTTLRSKVMTFVRFFSFSS